MFVPIIRHMCDASRHDAGRSSTCPSTKLQSTKEQKVLQGPAACSAAIHARYKPALQVCQRRPAEQLRNALAHGDGKDIGPRLNKYSSRPQPLVAGHLPAAGSSSKLVALWESVPWTCGPLLLMAVTMRSIPGR